MANNQHILIVDYLQSSTGFNDGNFQIIREQYRQQCGGSFPTSLNDLAAEQVSEELNIKIDTPESLLLLYDCVSSSEIDDSRLLAKKKLASIVQSQNAISIEKKQITSFATTMTTNNVSATSKIDDNGTLLTEINCVLDIKMAWSDVSNFVHSFLLEAISQRNQSSEITKHFTIDDEQPFLLNTSCLLYLYIRLQMSKNGTITSTSHSNSHRFRVLEPIKFTDDFSDWEYDHWQGLLGLELEPHGSNTRFPAKWRLAENVSIYCRITNSDPHKSLSPSSLIDRSQSELLESFLKDVCERENNILNESWLRALQQEKIFHLEQLINLDKKGWHQIQRLTSVEKYKLKICIEQRYRTNENGINCSNNEKTKQMTRRTSAEQSSTFSSELYAKIHLIKLCVLHELKDPRAIQLRNTLTSIEPKCLDAAFEEMQAEGFADDSLFQRIKEFFFTLTISDQDLNSQWSLSGHVQQAWSARSDQLLVNLNQLQKDFQSEKDTYQNCMDEIRQVQKNIKDEETNHEHILDQLQSKKPTKGVMRNLQRRLSITSKSTKQIKEETHNLYLLLQKSKQKQSELSKELNQLMTSKVRILQCMTDWEKQIAEKTAHRKMIKNKLNTPHEPIDKQLVKSPRGLILYGPPGTGKSNILSKLAKKLGVVMVGPPLAAGELNRSLVGESERILIALCSRCNHVPYAQCCISIDEIDSLAPKRDQNSSEGKVDKISVMLSMIEGIKDVSNLMIFSATNRLHMMDEAFLRRLSGKFFVGRPSSNARMTLLRKIPFWMLEPELLDRLSIATTNFSGAAVIALNRDITTHCIKMGLTKPIDEIEALKLADTAAQNHQIFIGSETLPRLLLRNLLTDSRPRIYQLPEKYKYSGRMIVDLHNKYIRIEVLQSSINTSTNIDELSMLEYALDPNETNVQTLLERLTAYGKSRNVQLLQLIDLNLLASKNAHDEKQVYETLKDRYDECAAYTRSMIIYDLDALVGITKSESDSNTGRSTSYAIHNHGIHTYVLARFRDRIMEDIKNEHTDNVERWAIAVIREPFLLRQFCTDVQFPRTSREEEELEFERQKAEDIIKCVKCKDFYIENENRMGSCVHHDGFLYDNSESDLKIYTPSQAAIFLGKLEHQGIKNSTVCAEFELKKKTFKWICCDDTFTVGRSSGCKRGKHGFFVLCNNQSNENVTNNKVNRITQATIEEWEEACHDNEEYNEKWFELTQQY